MAWKLIPITPVINIGEAAKVIELHNFTFSQTQGTKDYWALGPLETGNIYIYSNGRGLELNGGPLILTGDLDPFLQIQTITHSIYNDGNGNLVPIPRFNENAIKFPTLGIIDVKIDWEFDVIGLHHITGGSSVITFGGAAPFPNFWNDRIWSFVQQLGWLCKIQNLSPIVDWNLELDHVETPWLEGSDTLVIPPTNIDFHPVGYIDLNGGQTEIKALSDASGIYTVISGQHHDKFYQRHGSTTSIVTVEIPEPFFKTGFIGDK